MLTLWGKRQTFCDSLSRRDFLQIGAFGAGLTLAEMLGGRALPPITLTVTRGPLAGQHYVFDEPTACVIGRADDCTISLSQDAEFAVISRHHCLLDITPPAIRIRDLGSANGTFVNGRKIGQRDSGTEPGAASQDAWPAIELSAGDEILLADHTAFRVSVSLPPDPGIAEKS